MILAIATTIGLALGFFAGQLVALSSERKRFDQMNAEASAESREVVREMVEAMLAKRDGEKERFEGGKR